MNERIKELAQEVFSCKYKTDPNELNPGHHMDHLHKFAELIVRECINVIGESRESRQTAMYYRHRIAEHFEIL